MVMFGGVDSIEQNTRTNKVLLPNIVIFVFQCFRLFFYHFAICDHPGVHSLVDCAKPEGDGLGSCLSLHSTHCQAPKGELYKTFIVINLTEVNLFFSFAYSSRQAALLAEGVPSGCLETLKSPAEQAAVCG